MRGTRRPTGMIGRGPRGQAGDRPVGFAGVRPATVLDRGYGCLDDSPDDDYPDCE